MLSGPSVVGKAVLISRSTDGELTWQAPVVAASTVSGFFDKEWVACDTFSASPNYGNCYVQWDNANAGNHLNMSRSTDGNSSSIAFATRSSMTASDSMLRRASGTSTGDPCRSARRKRSANEASVIQATNLVPAAGPIGLLILGLLLAAVAARLIPKRGTDTAAA